MAMSAAAPGARNHGLEWARRAGGQDSVPPEDARRSVVRRHRLRR